MRKTSFLDKVFFGINILFGICLMLSCFVPYISAETVPFVTFFSLSIPILVLVNLIFVLFWGFRRKKQMFLSLFTLLIGYFSLSSFFMFRFSETAILDDDLSVMTYNVRSFNESKSLRDGTILEKILEVITHEDPDIICFQEFGIKERNKFKKYTYHYVESAQHSRKVKLAVYSKYPIISKGLLNFPDSGNEGAFVDIVFKKDTVRVYNVHIESLRIVPNPEVLAKEASTKLYKRLTATFMKQQQQAEIISAHKKTTKHKTIVCGDFNGTQYANVYRTIRGDMQDTFQEKGTGYGRTYNFKYYPVRIDFILADKKMEVLSHKNYNVKLSDHFPVMASFRF